MDTQATKLVEAIAKGHDGKDIRNPGERFPMPLKAKGSWFVDVAPIAAPATKPARPRQENSPDDLA